MKRIRLMGLALIAIFALGASAASSAFAENPEILPVPTVLKPAKFTSKAGVSTLLTTKGTVVECKKATNKGEFTTQDSGTVDIDFHECKGTINGKTSPCNSPGKEKELILVEGEVQLVDVLPTATLDLGLWIKPHEDGSAGTDLHFTCGIPTFVVLGAVIGVVDNSSGVLLKELEKTKEIKVLWKESSVLSEQQIKECMLLKALCILPNEKPNIFQLEIEFGKGHELLALIADATLVFEKEYEFHF